MPGRGRFGGARPFCDGHLNDNRPSEALNRDRLVERLNAHAVDFSAWNGKYASLSQSPA